MHPDHLETIAAGHRDDLEREATRTHRLARATGIRSQETALSRLKAGIWRLATARTGSAWRLNADVARPGGDLGPSRRAKLGQDVLHVTAGGLGRDPE